MGINTEVLIAIAPTVEIPPDILEKIKSVLPEIVHDGRGSLFYDPAVRWYQSEDAISDIEDFLGELNDDDYYFVKIVEPEFGFDHDIETDGHWTEVFAVNIVTKIEFTS